ncbi:uncharacterized protein ARMOST_12322 [Armillaria ostoyae]|uniref:Secreted protein n=1 Tax=Armillaria ostoyae TaxID=47428 RepID=A0A284RJP8_ARMOS|nr:uncharacterized protein ARMOST_12322 [Armillaria ostoyae]
MLHSTFALCLVLFPSLIQDILLSSAGMRSYRAYGKNLPVHVTPTALYCNLPWAIATSRDCFPYSKKRANTCSTQTSPLVPDNSKDFCQYILEQASKKAASFLGAFCLSRQQTRIIVSLNSDLGGDVDKREWVSSRRGILLVCHGSRIVLPSRSHGVGEPEEQQEMRKNPLSLATPSLSRPTHRHPTAAQELGNLLFCHFESGGVNVLLYRLPMQIEANWGWRRNFSSRLRERSTVLGVMDEILLTKLTASKSRSFRTWSFPYRSALR